MRKAVLLGALASLAALSFGCAFTDYPSIAIPANKTHGLISCVTDDRGLNTQQTYERELPNLLLAVKDAAGNTPCPVVGGMFLPPVTTEGPNHTDAREWGRFLGTWIGFTGGGVVTFGVPCQSGQWEMAGMKDLADGTRRLATYHTTVSETPPYFNPFSCGFSWISSAWGPPGNGGKSGAIEGAVIATGYDVDGPGTAFDPDYRVDTIALDNRPGTEFCANIAAMTPRAATCGYSTLWAGTARFGEHRPNFTPITRHAGLSEFFAGQPLTARFLGVDATLRGEILDSGRIRVTIDSLATPTATYTAGERPITVDINTSGRLMPQVIVPGSDELRGLAEFALRADLADRQFDLPKFVPEFGLTLPSARFVISGDALRAFLDNNPPGEGGGGFGG